MIHTDKQNEAKAEKPFKSWYDENKDGKLNESPLEYVTSLIEFKKRISKMSKKQFEQHLEVIKKEYKKRYN
tara:strand:- start:265 stop:477 length:213 start_codon:yes stop_codon:yes gene_type:complete